MGPPSAAVSHATKRRRAEEIQSLSCAIQVGYRHGSGFRVQDESGAGHVSEVSAAIVYLLSPAAAFVSGACLRIDGAAATARNRTFAPHARSVPYEGFHLPSSPDLWQSNARTA